LPEFFPRRFAFATHQAFAFDWVSFENGRYHEIVDQMLAQNDTAPCLDLIEYRTEFGVEGSGVVDHITGYPITQEWMDQLPLRDVQWCIDFLLSQFYSIHEDFGVGPRWSTIQRELPSASQVHLTGRTLGPPERPFDPTGLGSSFLDVDDVVAAIRFFSGPIPTSLASYIDLLERCGAASMGIYVRFS
jgi:hypothetical protein